MKIEVEKYIFKEDEIDASSVYRIIVAEKCCDEILDNEFISLTVDDEGEDYGFKLSNQEELSLGDGDYIEQWNYKPIKYCPFCGKPLEVVIDDTFDLTEEYNRLHDERDRLWNLCNKTDSKKKSEELLEQVRQLDKEIQNRFYENDGMEELIKLVKGDELKCMMKML